MGGILWFILLSAPTCAAQLFQPPSRQQCQPITIPQCMNLPYNLTMMPNLLEHATQEDAAAAIAQFKLLIQVNCSRDIQLFLCTLHAPLCAPVLNRTLSPCKHLCHSAKQGCEALMSKFGFRWPEHMECSRFPDTFCVGENRTMSSEKALECPQHMRTHVPSQQSLELTSGRLLDCSIPCKVDNSVPIFFNLTQRHFIRVWTAFWATSSFICSVFTICTFLIDLKRFSYPVRPILYMTVSYMCISVVYMIGLGGENSFACASGGSPQAPPLVARGVGSNGCTLLAVTYYFFSMASATWWLVLCVCWFLAARLQWGQESIESYGVQLHFFAWGVPGILSIAVMVTEAVDGDLFTGICSIGNLSPWAQLLFVVVPQGASILLGLVLLALGIMSMVSIRSYYKVRATVDGDIAKLEKLMLRVSLFAVLYALPTALSTSILAYQAIQMPVWLEYYYASRCARPDRALFGFSSSSCPSPLPPSQPDLVVFAAKYLTQLMVGVTCAVWVFSLKTVASYQQAYARIFNRDQSTY